MADKNSPMDRALYADKVAHTIRDTKKVTDAMKHSDHNKLSAMSDIKNNLRPRLPTPQFAETLKRYTEKVPSFKKGGSIKKTGIYKLHKGERVTPAGKRTR